ncbi:hypothetical protein Acr_27g0006920 [Actinidia rufa]|uniref:Uncharacterized protein n=1 Tax=Actinidia rufa TaxID=165716 RepID=A0A7J0H765_9ERIC|nr:hypothetical protein Acr_27g0006920 [Actinidia rufa]
MGSLNDGKVGQGCKNEEKLEGVVKPKAKANDNTSECNVEPLCGYLSEETIKEVMVKTGLVEQDEKALDAVETHHERDRDERKNVMISGFDDRWPVFSWSAFDEEPLMGWIWYPYTDEELVRFHQDDEEVVWEPDLWNWNLDVSENPIP